MASGPRRTHSSRRTSGCERVAAAASGNCADRNRWARRSAVAESGAYGCTGPHHGLGRSANGAARGRCLGSRMGWNPGLHGRDCGSCGGRDRCPGCRRLEALSQGFGCRPGHGGDRGCWAHRLAPAPAWARRFAGRPGGDGLGGSGDSHRSTSGLWRGVRAGAAVMKAATVHIAGRGRAG